MKRQTVSNRNPQFKSPLKNSAQTQNKPVTNYLRKNSTKNHQELGVNTTPKLNSTCSEQQNEQKAAAKIPVQLEKNEGYNDFSVGSKEPHSFKTPVKRAMDRSPFELCKNIPNDSSLLINAPLGTSHTVPITKRTKTALKHVSLFSPQNDQLKAHPMLNDKDDLFELMVKKREIQTKLKSLKDNISLVQTAINVSENKKIEEADKLIIKWRNALISSSENLFELSESTLKDQYELQKQRLETERSTHDRSNSLEGGNSYYSDKNDSTSQENFCPEDESLYDFMIRSMAIDAELLLP